MPTILLVEDDSLSVRLIQRAFRKTGLTNPLQIVNDGEQAVAYLAGQSKYADRTDYPLPALILLDLYMPRKSGHEVLAWMREQPGLKDLPVVVLTASQEPADIEKAYSLGAQSYLLKPMTPESLKEVVNIFAPVMDSNPRVLLLDDDPDMRTLAVRVLRKEFPGAQIEQVGVPDELSPALEKDCYDLVITDYEMHWTDGLKLLRIVKARWPECPVIMFTASGSEEVAVEAMRAGLDDYVLKKPQHFARLPVAARLVMARARHRKMAKEAEERYRSLFETVPVGLFRCTPAGKLTDANPAFIQMLGYSDLQPLLALSLADTFVNRDDLKRWAKGINCEETIHNFEVQLYRRDNAIIWGEMNAHTVCDVNDNLLYYEGILQDITERRQAEKKITKAAEEWQSTFDSIKDAVMLLTPDLRIVRANSSAASFFNIRMDKIQGKYCHALMHWTDKPLESCPVARLLETKQHEETEVYDDKRGVWLLVSVDPIMDDKGNITGIVHIVRDVTERKHLESQLRQALKMEAIGTLAGGVAHDFNNILTALIGYGTLLQMQLDSDNPLRIYADQILSSSHKAANLTQSLLSFSRKQPITLRPVALNSLIRGTDKLLKRLLTEDIALQTILASDDMTIMGDATQIDQILFNLVSNARDAMPKGGRLTIKTELAVLDREFAETFGYGEPGAHAVISVSDTGTGMDEATKEKIFDPFFTTKEVGKGTGLGLSTVYGIVKQHKGHVNVQSEQGKGTTFHIYLPAIQMAAGEEKTVYPAVKRGKETVLVAEDNEEVRNLVKQILADHGYTPIIAADGEDALIKFKENKNIALLLLDSVMPKKNGREVYDEIKKIDPDIKALFTSGYTRDIVLDKGIEEKDFHFISKPIIPRKLLEKLREILDK
ncbi:MAG: response regulator [Proteobacteria bacterium]|nr:response regulator [Pseudomonadota bacterium]